MSDDIKAVPFFRPSIGEAEIEAVSNCLRSGWLTTGPMTLAFEKAFASKISSEVSAIAVNSATAALHLGLDALGIGPGDEVIVPTLTFTATAEVVRYMGATPVFVDIDPKTLCLSLEAFDAAINSKTKVVMPVHFGGRPCDMTAIRKIANNAEISVLDDAAHAFPATHAESSIGDCNSESGADLTAFSFYANKTMTTGEGGMLVTRNHEFADRARKMRLHGIDRDVFNRFTDVRASWMYDVVAPGYKYNLTDVASAMGSVQLDRADGFLQRRREIAARYDAAFADLPIALPPHGLVGDVHSWHLYLVQILDDAPIDRDAFIAGLKQAGIGCSVHYRPLHLMSVWKPYAVKQHFPFADAYFARCVTLPLFMDMTEAEQARVITVVRELLK